jgi:2-methylaconitate cis-trans-isomerase PrpF
MMIRDRLHRVLAVNAGLGVVTALVIVGAILALDTGGLRTLMLGDPGGAVALALLAGGFIITCASVMMGSAIMIQARASTPRDSGPRGGHGALIPIPVRARRR